MAKKKAGSSSDARKQVNPPQKAAKKPTQKKPTQKKAASQKSSSPTKGSNKAAPAKKAVSGKGSAEPPEGGERFPIVGIGASAGGLAALKQFFQHVPEDSGLAYVVVVHLSPDHKSHLAELLQPHVKMPIEQVTETVPLEPNRVYVIPPGSNLDTIDTHLRLTELEKRRQERAPIDHFFGTLARTHDGDAIGVVLSGTGSDGTLGLREIKEVGGLCLVQSPQDAEYDGMPQSAIATGLIDLVLPIADIPGAILKFVRTTKLTLPQDGEEVNGDMRRQLQKVFAQICARTGRDFSRYKRSTVLRRIQRRMQLRHVEDFDSYVGILRQHPEEVRTLADDLLITVTNFFRDDHVFAALEKDVIPKIFEGKSPDDQLRVWSVGCATGEEAYSLAMLLSEYASQSDTPPRLQIFASDLHDQSLHKAREGLYPGDVKTDVSPERLKRFFLKEDGGYRIRKVLREMVVFAPHNLLGDPPFSRVDLVSCRNLLIYLQRDAQRDVIELFHYALRPSGYLCLGTSETLDASDLFQLVNKKGAVYRKRNVRAPEPRLPVFPLTGLRLPEGQEDHARRAEPAAYGAMHQRIVERYAPPSVLVGPDDKVVHLSEHAGRYLVHPGGELTASIVKLVREELRIVLRSLLHRAREHGEPTSSEPIPVKFNGQRAPVVLHARPSLEPQQEGFVLVLFEEREAQADIAPAKGKATAGDGQAESATERELRAELDVTRQRLQAAIEEYETTNEEMRASNEEMQSSNEELRSTLEELETSKEELQSMNEELQAVNQENRHKVEELAQLSSDLQNLMLATDIATLFLDRDLRILRFTPKISELFKVRLADRSRPISDFSDRLGYHELQDDTQQVLATLEPVERELQDEQGRWYLTRVRPYRSSEDRIEGVVLTFVDVTARKQAEEEVHKAKVYAESIVETLHDPLLVLNADLTIRSCNSAFYEHFQVIPSETTDCKIYELGNGQWDIPELRTLLEDVLPDSNVFNDFEVTHHFETIGHRVMLMSARRLDHVELLLLGIRDITEHKRAEEALRESEERLRLAAQAAYFGSYSYDFQTDRAEWSPELFTLCGIEPAESLTSRQILERIHPTDRRAFREHMQRAIRAAEGKEYAGEFRILRPTGEARWMANRGTILPSGSGLRAIRAVGMVVDITDQKLAQNAIQMAKQSLEQEVAKRTEMLELLQDVTRAANEARSVDESLLAALKRISDHNGWQVGHVWKADDVGHGPVLSSGVWHVGDESELAIGQLAEFQELCAPMQFGPGEGIVGEVLASGKPQWIDDISQSKDWRRGEAGQLGLHAMVAFPVFINQKVAAVIEFFSDLPANRDEQFLQIMPDVGIQLGHVIERHRLARQAAQASEIEQRRIGSDIHDGVGQELSGLRYLAQTHVEAFASPAGANEKVAERIAVGLEAVQKQLRWVIRDLVPVQLDEEGLAAALRSLAQRTSERHDLKCLFKCPQPLAVEDNLLATHVYRIAQEAVNNAIQHAQASQIQIRLEQENGRLHVEVADNGVGITPGVGIDRGDTRQDGYGLRSMAYRARLIDAQLNVTNPPTGGTKVTCDIPLKR